ncbi:MAG: peptidoglycan-binding domain-containing protein [Cuspidothrix sp.]
MTAIGSLIMGVLNPERINIPHFIPYRLSIIENDVHLKNHQLNPLVTHAQTTPPEFSQMNQNPPTHSSMISFRQQKILKQISQRYNSSNHLELADSRIIPKKPYKKDIQPSTRYSTIQRKPMPIIGFGSSGTSVRVLQKLLISNGYGVPVDGVFGPVTEIAVKAFQNRRRLSADGLVGQKTWSELTI